MQSSTPFLTTLLSLLLTLSLAASPTSFCKCTCFSNSTIIPLNAPRPVSSQQQHFTSPLLLLHTRDEDHDKGAEGGGGGGGGGGRDEEEGKKGNEDRKEFRAGNCGDCNRQYCIDAHLPICKDATVGDVVATCFQRDSRKDEAVVFIFIFATVGLLGWSAVKPWVARWVESAKERRNYIPVPNQGET